MKESKSKMSELRDKFTAARRAGKEASVLNGLVRPSCLIIDEVGHCEFDNGAVAIFISLQPHCICVVQALCNRLSAGKDGEYRGSNLVRLPLAPIQTVQSCEGAEIVPDVPYAVIAKSVHIRFCIRHGLIRLF